MVVWRQGRRQPRPSAEPRGAGLRLCERGVRIAMSASVVLSTTPGIEGKRITRYCGIVTGEAILGANIFKDLFAGIRDIVGGRSATYERELRRARELALDELAQNAAALGANAVVGIDLDYETVGGQGSMLMVSVSGTAVAIE
jgi:uncharacterized protein YbjQ (UPF0145 family)